MRVFLATMFVSLVVVACSSSTSVSAPAQACLDTAAAVAQASQRCNEDYQTAYNNFVENAAGGSCNNVTSIRDISSLYNTCIPSYQTVSCTNLNAGTLDASCDQQLIQN